MAYAPMFNFGSVRIGGVGGGSDISLDLGEASGQIKFTPETRSIFKSNNGRIHQRTIGYRVTITISFANVVSGTADKLSTLFSYLNLVQGYNNGSDAPISIYPRFSDELGIDDNYNYDCFLNSEVEMEDFATGVNVGQSGELVFISQDVHPMLTSSYPEFSTWEVLNNGSTDELIFNNGGTLENAKFKIK